MDCPRKNCKNKAEDHPVYGIIPCKSCRRKDAAIREAPEFATITMADRVQSQRDHHLGDIAQPWDKDGKPNKTFIQANPDAIDDYFTPEDLKEI